MNEDMKNVLLQNFTLHNTRGTPFAISQCTVFAGTAGNCNTSTFHLSDIIFKDVIGTLLSEPITSLQCSAASNCTDIIIENLNLKLPNGTAASRYLCNNAVDTHGFTCTGPTCNTGSSTGSCPKR